MLNFEIVDSPSGPVAVVVSAFVSVVGFFRFSFVEVAEVVAPLLLEGLGLEGCVYSALTARPRRRPGRVGDDGPLTGGRRRPGFGRAA